MVMRQKREWEILMVAVESGVLEFRMRSWLC